MDSWKFESMIGRGVLFFSRADRLGDKFEGSLSKKYYPPPSPEREALEKIFPEELLERQKRRKTEFKKALRRWTVVSCWNMGECDTDAMWKLYLKDNKGIAIQSTYRRLSESFNNYHADDVYIGVVNYIDYDKEAIPWQNHFFPFVYKKKNFEHERELRAVILRFPYIEGIPTEGYYKTEVFSEGLDVPVDLNNLIESVFVSPFAEEGFEEEVVSILKKFCFDKPLSRSPLSDEPIF